MTIAPQIDNGLQAQLDLARQVQLRLLPDRRCCLSDWEVAFSYESAGFVSGDYVDLIPAGADMFYFALGDVSGKGMAASILMSHLNATLRTLLPSNRSIEQVVTTASSTFCQSALPAQFATLVLGKADRSGMVELVNAGHNPVLLVEGGEVEVIATRTGSPKHYFNLEIVAHLSWWKRSNAPLFVTPMVRNQAMTAQCLRFAGHRKEFEQCHITTSCSSAQEIPHVPSWPRRS